LTVSLEPPTLTLYSRFPPEDLKEKMEMMASATNPMAPTASAEPIPERRFARMRKYNLGMGALHVLQAVAIIVLATDFALPVTGTFMAGPPGTPPKDPAELFSMPVGWAVAAFLLFSGLAHWYIASAGYRRYVAGLKDNRNDARWIEYSLSASLMIVLIAMLTGISDVAALIAIFGVNASMILFGLVQERFTQPGKDASLLPFWTGCIVGAVPWIAIGVYLAAPGSSAEPPAFVYAIFVSLFIFFNSFAINMYLQYRKIGKWRDYLFGESFYIALSLVAKSLLAWQVFAGTLAS